jgi:alpha-galactosidase
MIKLQSRTMTLTMKNKKGILQLDSQKFPGVGLSSRFEVIGEQNGKNISLIDQKAIFQSLPQEIHDRESQKFNFVVLPSVANSRVILSVMLPPDENFAFIQFSISNSGEKPIYLEKITLLDVLPGDLDLGRQIKEHHPIFFSNGWQSWSHTRTYQLGDKHKLSHLGIFQNPMVINPGTSLPKKRNCFSGDMFGVVGDQDTEIGLLAGFLSQKAHFGSLEASFHPQPAIKMWANGDHTLLKPGESMITDWAVLSFIDLSQPEPMMEYLDAVASEHNIHIKDQTPTGWCSWYHFYQDINEKVIETNLNSLVDIEKDLPLHLCQIDDGFEKQVGDWLDFSPGFPNGVQLLAMKIKGQGLTPGIWLAPFIVHPKAELVNQHPDWLLRNDRGKPVRAGFVWNALAYALDLTNPDALAYACKVIRTAVENWGFTYLKLDFLYAAALDGVYQDPTQTRAQVLRRGLEALREAAGPETTLLACGCPLGSALGLFEAMRISADVSGHWDPHFPPVSKLLKKEPGMPSARNALNNIVSRAFLHRHWWINDPDCLLVRPNSHLTLDEVQTLATVIGLTGGSLLVSDDLPALPPERLRIAQVLLPLIDQRANVIDWYLSDQPAHFRVDLDGSAGPWHLLGIINWEDKDTSLTFSPEVFKLPVGKTWWLREFWTGAIGKMGDDAAYTFQDITAHGCRVVAARPFHSKHPTYLGSDIHLSQGMEVSAWQAGEKNLRTKLKLNRQITGKSFLYLPWKPKSTRLGNEQIALLEVEPKIYQITLDKPDGKVLEILG